MVFFCFTLVSKEISDTWLICNIYILVVNLPSVTKREKGKAFEWFEQLLDACDHVEFNDSFNEVHL